MKIFKFCKKYLLSNKVSLAAYIILVLGAVGISIITPLFTGNFLDTVISNGSSNVVLQFCVNFSLLSASSILIGYVTTIIYAKLQANMAYKLNKDTINHVQSLSLSYTNQLDSTYLSQRINSDSNELTIFCMNVLQNIIANIIILIVPFIIMISINHVISLFLIVFFVLYIILYFASKNILYSINYALKEKKDNFFAKMHSELKEVKLIKINGLDSSYKLHKAYIKLYDVFIKNKKITYLVSGLDNIIQTMAQIMLFAIGGLQILDGSFSVGMFTIFSSYFNMVLNAGSYFFNLGKTYQVATVSLSRLLDIWSNKPESSGTKKLNDINTITLENVSLKSGDKELISNAFSAIYQKGYIYAVIGANGTGKSTLANLIMGMYIDEKQGDIKYNGININELDMTNFRRTKLAFAEQEPILISDTIRYNITMSREIKSEEDEKILKYAKILNIEDFVSNSMLGTFIEEEQIHTSGGEKQKIAILRTLYKDAEVMIFDEPTSALDEQTIKTFIKYLKDIKQEKIIIIITHDEKVRSMCDLTISVAS